MEQQSSRLTALVALMAVFTLAICFIIIGAVSEELKAGLGIDNAQLGSLVFALFLTSMIVELIIGPLVDKFGHRPLAILGFLVTGGALFLLANAASLNAALLACILLGVGAMSLNTVGNTLIPVVLFEGKDPARASNFGNAFFGLGYVLTPFLFSLFGRYELDYRTGISILAVLVLVFLVVSLAARYPQVSTGFEFAMAIRLLKEGPVLIAALALFCYVALEVSMGTWIKPYMTDVFGGASAPHAVANAGLVLTLFGVAMMVGRFLTSAVKNLTAIGTRVIAGAALVSILTLILMVLVPTPTVGTLVVLVTGLAFAPIFPTVVGVTFAKYKPHLYGSIFGIIFAVGLLGGTFIPKFIGNVSAAATAEQFSPDALWIAVVMAGILFLLSLVIGRTKPSQS